MLRSVLEVLMSSELGYGYRRRAPISCCEMFLFVSRRFQVGCISGYMVL